MSIVTNFTLTQYEKMVEGGVFAGPRKQRLELIRGEIREMNPIGIEHACTVDLIYEWSTENRPKSEVMVRCQAPIRIPLLESSPEPDVVWYARGAGRKTHPNPNEVHLVIEVAETSLAFDRGEKARLYAEAGIQDYWVVDCVGRTVEVFREPSATGYGDSQKYDGDDEIRLLAYPDIVFVPSQVLDQK